MACEDASTSSLTARLLADDIIAPAADGVYLRVFVQPRSSKNTVCGLHGDAVKIRITAPPVEGKANAAIIKFIAKLFSVPKSRVTVDGGAQSRGKRLLIQGVTPEDAAAVLAQAGL